MGMEFSAKFDFAAFEGFIGQAFYKANASGLRMGLNRAARGAITEADKHIRAEFPLGKGGGVTFKQRIFEDIKIGDKAEGDDIGSMFARIDVSSDKAVQMIRAVRSLRVSKRGSSPATATVRAGRSFSLGKNRFLQRKAGTLLVFTRHTKQQGDKKAQITPQRLKRVALMLQDEKVWPPFETGVNTRVEAEVSRAISHALDKL
jgi:hypothetical protein